MLRPLARGEARKLSPWQQGRRHLAGTGLVSGVFWAAMLFIVMLPLPFALTGHGLLAQFAPGY